MRNYYRTIRETFRYKFTIIISIVCACLIGLLWGVNIGTVYPFVEVSFNGETIGQWIVKETDKYAEKCLLIEHIIAERKGTNSPPLPEIVDLEAKLAKLEKRTDFQLESDLLIAEQSEIWYRHATPFVQKYTPDDPFKTVVFLVFLVFIGTVIKSILIFAHGLLVAQLTRLSAYHMRDALYQKLLDYEVNYFSREGVADSMSRMTGDIGVLTQGIGILYGKMVREPVKLLACLIGAALVSWQLLLLTLLIAPISAYLIGWLAKSIRRVVKRSLQQTAVMFSRLEESFRAIRIIKTFTRERFERAQFRRTNRALLAQEIKAAKYGALTSPMTEVLGMSMIFIAIIAGAYLVLYEQTHLLGIPMTKAPMSLGALVLFFALLAGASDPARRLSDIFAQFQSAAAAADRVYALIDRDVPLKEVENPEKLPRHSSSIVFEDIFYAYRPDRQTLKNVSFEIKFGETLAIIGPSGCGKSTLINLLIRFMDPDSGKIKVDGIDIKTVKFRDLRRQFGYVTQEPMLFNETVFNNISYGNPTASDDEIFTAAKQANAHEFIEKDLPNGYATMVGPSGSLLSGGQRQRIAIARAMVRDPAIFLLDEATSQIDVNSERIIHEALAKYMGTRTTIMVTHRLSSLSLADRILIMNEGEVLDLGTHEELMARCPYYADLRSNELEIE